jgi:tol-pal system protein YbgF
MSQSAENSSLLSGTAEVARGAAPESGPGRCGMPAHRSNARHAARALAASLGLFVATGCVSPADHRKLENRVAKLSRSQQQSTAAVQTAELTADLQSLHGEIAELRGRVDIAERQASEALAQSGKARRELAAVAGSQASGARPPTDSDTQDPPELAAAESGSAELMEYRSAYSEWRAGDYDGCIDQFRKFLQTYPASSYADDAAYWRADCHFEQEDYRNAVLRFDDVVRNYPTGNRAPDALYRQGEALLKLGPGFNEAAKRAFERVLNEYPGSPPAKQASEQLEALGAR